MKRLTDKKSRNPIFDAQGGLCVTAEFVDRLAEYEDTGLSPEEIMEFLEDIESRFILWVNKKYEMPAGKFLDIMQANKDGRLVVLPCKPEGDAK